MNIIFEIIDKNKKLIRLTDKQHSHMMDEHPYMSRYMEEIKDTLKKPDKITSYSFDEGIRYFYKGYKHLDKANKYLVIIVKYLNGEGFIISSYLETKIK